MTPVAPSPARPEEAAFPFLRLPGELRNRIYKLTLTAPEGQLVYCDNPLASDSGLYRARTAIPNDGRRVFDDVRSSDRFFEDIDSSREFNQLKFVCRQLYKETAGLEAKFNIIVWVGCPPRSISSRTRFPLTLPSSWENKLHTLVLRPSLVPSHLQNPSDNLDDIDRYFGRERPQAEFLCDLMYFCCNYPNLKIDWVMEGFALKPPSFRSFAGAADAIIAILRGPELSHLSLHRQALGIYTNMWLGGPAAVYARRLRERGNTFAKLTIFPDSHYVFPEGNYARTAVNMYRLFAHTNSPFNLAMWVSDDPAELDHQILEIHRTGI